MKKLLIAIVLMLSVGWSIDPLFVYLGVSQDKSLHAAFSYMETDWLEDDIGYEPWQSFLILGAVGVAKETVDVWFGGKFDHEDIVANYAGWAIYRLVDFEWKF